MRCSRQNRFLIGLLAVLAQGCASSSFYKVANVKDGRVELSVTPDRVLLECEDTSENREIPYGFMMHILDGENTVLDVVQGNTLSREDCQRRLDKIGRILKTGRTIYVGGIGGIDDPKVVEKWTYDFPHHGKFHSNGRVLQLIVTANDRGLCYGVYTGDAKPCPDGEEFPLPPKR